MADPKLADVINPKLAAQRRMEAEGQAVPGLPDTKRVAAPASAPASRFGKQWTPEERAKQNAALAAILSKR
jgi:hypothetical protein